MTAGYLVQMIDHESVVGDGVATWNLLSRSGQWVANGVYFYHIATPQGEEHTGRFTVIGVGA